MPVVTPAADADTRPRRPAARIVTAFALIALAAWIFVARASHRMPDFEVYWQAGARAASAEPLYRISDADYQFKYFPAFAVLAIPFGLMPLGVAKAIWFALSAIALIVLLRLSVVILPERRMSRAVLIAALLVCLGKYYAEELVLGQINTVVALAVTVALLAFSAGRDSIAGVLIGLSVVLKPYALILLPWIAARRRWPPVVSAAITLAIACVLPLPLYGVDGTIALYRDWWRTVSDTTAGTLLHSDNVSLASLWAKRLGIGTSATLLTAASSLALLTGAAIVFLKRERVAHPDMLEAGILLALTPLVSPQGWDYVLILGTTLVVCVVNGYGRLPRGWRITTMAAIPLVGLSLYDLLGRRLIYLLLDWSLITVGMVLLLAAAVTLRLRRVA